MQGLQFIPQDTIIAAHNHARQGNWQVIYSQCSINVYLLYQTDPREPNTGWTLMDHAVYQMRLDVVNMLRNRFHNYSFPNAAPILFHAQKGNWTWIVRLLEINVLLANLTYHYIGRNNFTLLDLAIAQNNTRIASMLRQRYKALTFKENAELFSREDMFKAANKKDWQKVYNILDKQQVHVDSIDPCVNKGWVLLQYAYRERNQEVILKLIGHYSASLDELRNADIDLYNEIVEIYEATKLGENDRQVEDLTNAFEDLALKKTENHFGPIARPLLIGYGLKRSTNTDVLLEERGIHLLHRDFPDDDRALTNSKSSRMGHQA